MSVKDCAWDLFYIYGYSFIFILKYILGMSKILERDVPTLLSNNEERLYSHVKMRSKLLNPYISGSYSTQSKINCHQLHNA